MNGTAPSPAPKRSSGEALFLDALAKYAPDIPAPTEQHLFAKAAMGRMWRFDFAWMDAKVAVEIHGATFTGGRHTRGKGMDNDCAKSNAAVGLGWRLLTFTTAMLKRDPQACVEMLVAVLGATENS